MKSLFLLAILIIFGFTSNVDEYTVDDFLLEEGKENVYKCTPYKETGLLWGFNKLVGESPITLKTWKEQLLITWKYILLDDKKMEVVAKEYFEDKRRRMKLVSYSSNNYDGNVEIREILIDTKNKTTWYHCTLSK